MYEKFKPYINKRGKVAKQYSSAGAFSCSKSVLSKLTEELWNDLLTKLKIEHLAIYTVPQDYIVPACMLPCLPNDCTIIITNNEAVYDIYFQPWYS
jgi:hypothetical protein